MLKPESIVWLFSLVQLRDALKSFEKDLASTTSKLFSEELVAKTIGPSVGIFVLPQFKMSNVDVWFFNPAMVNLLYTGMLTPEDSAYSNLQKNLMDEFLFSEAAFSANMVKDFKGADLTRSEYRTYG